MVDVVASIQNAIDVTSKLRALSKKIENAEFSMLLADLTMELADSKLQVANLKTELANAIEEKVKLSQKINQAELKNPEFNDGGYKFAGDSGLFCTGCYDKNGQKIRLTAIPEDFRFSGKWHCPVCRSDFS